MCRPSAMRATLGSAVSLVSVLTNSLPHIARCLRSGVHVKGVHFHLGQGPDGQPTAYADSVRDISSTLCQRVGLESRATSTVAAGIDAAPERRPMRLTISCRVDCLGQDAAARSVGGLARERPAT